MDNYPVEYLIYIKSGFDYHEGFNDIIELLKEKRFLELREQLKERQLSEASMNHIASLLNDLIISPLVGDRVSVNDEISLRCILAQSTRTQKLVELFQEYDFGLVLKEKRWSSPTLCYLTVELF